MKKMPGVVDELNGIENTISGPAHVSTVDPVAAARAGFSAQEVGTGRQRRSARRAGFGAGGGERPLVHHPRALSDQTPQTLDSVQKTLLVSGTGKTATLGSLTKMVEDPGQNEIRRENLQRNVQVTARFEGINLGDGMKKVQQTIADMKLPPSIRVQYGGVYAEQQKSFKDFAFVLGWRWCWCSSCCCSNSAISPRPPR
jgi:multidrug efflux pump subunit AcrB